MGDAKVPHRPADLHHCPVAAQQADDEEHEGDDQQQVDKRANRVGPDDSQEPGDQENHRECIQHGSASTEFGCKKQDLIIIAAHTELSAVGSSAIGSQLNVSVTRRPVCTATAGGQDMSLQGKYSYAIQTSKDMRMQGGAEERDGKLYIKGTVDTQEQANKIWDAIKTIPDWRNEIVADIKATGVPQPSAPATYTVKPGDTLSKIAKEHLGNANAYMDIFNANTDQLQDPDKIKPGQVLKIPQVSHR